MPLPNEMDAVTIDRLGGLDLLKASQRPVPEVGAGEVLIPLGYAGVGTWDPAEREGFFAKLSGKRPALPVMLGSDGSGRAVGAGAGVERFHEGDPVYALGSMNPKGGFYAESVAIALDTVSPLPDGLALDQGGAMPTAALTVLQGLDDTLHVARGAALLILGASGDLGHVAVPMAKRMGARASTFGPAA